jgi:hypothetical protein
VDYYYFQVWRLITSKVAFLDTKDLICGALLIYYFRIFERKYGSTKFAVGIQACGLNTVTLIIFHIDILQSNLSKTLSFLPLFFTIVMYLSFIAIDY